MGSGRIDTAVFLQARLNSRRLPYKAILPLKGGSILQHAVRSLARIDADLYLLLTDKRSERFLAPHLYGSPFRIFTGPEDDVLARFCMASRKYSVRTIIRATGDNPLVSSAYAMKILKIHRSEMADLSHYLGLPLGTGVEIVESGALYEVEGSTDDSFEREHLTAYMYRNRERFKIIEPYPENSAVFEGAEVSVDTVSDYALVSEIFRDLYKGIPIEAEEIVCWLKGNLE